MSWQTWVEEMCPFLARQQLCPGLRVGHRGQGLEDLDQWDRALIAELHLSELQALDHA